MKFQFNKTELQRISKQLKARYSALPTLKNKESALRAEIKRHKDILRYTRIDLAKALDGMSSLKALFTEFPEDLVGIEKVSLTLQKIAGVKIPVFQDVEFNVKPYSYFDAPSWFLDGVDVIKEVTRLKIKVSIEEKRIKILEYARKKTTQKVNLYEKVQIPEFEEAIIKIKRFLGDVENLDRASQKIVKKRKAAVL
ncbi:MAG: V-type ATP synthase subunit D [Bacteriovoracaceae bacterium]|nr:V-type ATP synthase subunit D [Bacteriovoracaceae bacterium]